MSKKSLNDWFNSLDSYELGIIFSEEYEEAMESADPKVNINTFIRDCKAAWRNMSNEEKEEIYNSYKD